MSIIETHKICQKFNGKEIITDIDLKIEAGEVFALIGPTGSGKTTLLRILDLIDSPSSGTVFFQGDDITTCKEKSLSVRRKMAYVQQRPLVFNMNVFSNISCGLQWRSEKKHVINRKTEAALEMVGMSEFKNRNARTLSGGEIQRVAIARALVIDPELIFLDEPTANMDPVSTAKIEEVLSLIIKEKKKTIMMTTHNMSQGQRMADRVGVIINGRLLQTGNCYDIFNMPENKEVAEFIGAENILSGLIQEKQDDLAAVNVSGIIVHAITALNIGESVHILVRPEDVTFTTSRDKSSARNVLQGKIVKVNTIGSTVRIEIDCGFPLMGIITVNAAEELGLCFGKIVYASFKATAVRVMKRWN